MTSHGGPHDILIFVKVAQFESISRVRSLADAVRITATYVGERVEAEVFRDGQVWVSCFKGDESVGVA